MKIIFTIIFLFVIVIGAFFFYRAAQTQSTYQGLPTVACIDPTKPIARNFTFFLTITINGKLLPLDSNIGHDYGNCLHEIFVNDSSGKVYVQVNDMQNFTLGQFFDVWHKTFFNMQKVQIIVNGQPVNTYRETLLTPGEQIEVRYQ